MSNFFSIQSAKERRPSTPLTEVAVRSFGSVASADLKLGALTILVGKNNTGKSYIAALLWALRSLSIIIGRGSDITAITPPEWFIKEVERVKLNGEGFIELDAEAVSDVLNAYFKKNKNIFVQRIMTLNDISIGSLTIKASGKIFLHYNPKIPKEFALPSLENNAWQVSWKNKLPKRFIVNSAVLTSTRDDVSDIFGMLVSFLVQQNISSGVGAATYVPAARTGLMLTLGYVASSLIGSLGLGNQTIGGKFTLPTIRFLQMLTQGNRGSRGIKGDVADFLESNILNGKIVETSEDKAIYHYRPNSCEHDLPMHAVSSMVSELTPILSALRARDGRSGIVLEEPEAHLHLSAQRYMARAIARLVNEGVPVILTTHSDTFLQQINLLIRLRSHPDKDKLMADYGYREDELIDISSAEAYEFISDGRQTTVVPADKSDDGFIIKSLNDELIDIAQEAMAIR